jgi:hypothetical protein
MNKEDFLTKLLLIVLRTPLREPEQALLNLLSHDFGLPDFKLYELTQAAKEMPPDEVKQCLYRNEQRRHLFTVRVAQIGPKRLAAQLYEPKGRTPRQNWVFPIKLQEVRKEIFVYFILGERPTAIHRWLTNVKGITCSLRGVYKLLSRKRSRRYLQALKVSVLGDTWLLKAVLNWLSQKDEEWRSVISDLKSGDLEKMEHAVGNARQLYGRMEGLRSSLNRF